ncbi:ATP synthase F1 subcomplex epsilon subunit [Quadrisphaera granulorum]|uniref:ATP synthase epsilon chain n=1 Tax=Quadrisphaera granulorum TaxID=317664 RepID=A0A316AET3_9ACTN|nr:F0F1 ATP synthase subunit epsilon [Quadrisphaera granulorum]PWJ56295.1 ATP synthase F1 subcomplex epsilon subunit [Quadrisphaera granulorum]SZE94929.1 ATP synthase F1 subcomplex epsilon subunit [Quadrisphaera granulorum]
MSLQVQVVSAEREVWTGEATMVLARTLEGEIGILTGHEPMLAVLAAGEVRVDGVGGAAGITAHVDGGFLSVEHDTVLVVAERARVGERA